MYVHVRSGLDGEGRGTVGSAAMRAVTFQAPGEVAVQEVAEPELLDAGDAIVQIQATGVCGSDLHIYHGRVQIEPGFTLGHEYVGTVIAVGDGVREVAVGDRVLGCFQTACGHCWFCRHGWFHKCDGRGPSATAPRSARCRAPRPSARSCPTPTSCCARSRRA